MNQKQGHISGVGRGGRGGGGTEGLFWVSNMPLTFLPKYPVSLRPLMSPQKADVLVNTQPLG